jgi:hypothetical protein
MSDASVSRGGFGVRVSGHEQVHIAAGTVAEQLHLAPGAAFDRLRGHAFAQGWLLLDVAAEVLARRLRLGDLSPEDPDRDPRPRPTTADVVGAVGRAPRTAARQPWTSRCAAPIAAR